MIKLYDKVVYLPTDSIFPYENNARVNKTAVEALVKAIPVMGFNVPIVIDKNAVIVKGHSRWEACKRLGIELVPCIVIDGSEEDIAEERLVDNKLSELATWDDEKLKYELRELSIDLSKFEINIPQIKSEASAVAPVTDVQVERTREQMIGKDMEVSAQKKSLIEIHCPYCNEDFFADMQEAMKYAN